MSQPYKLIVKNSKVLLKQISGAIAFLRGIKDNNEDGTVTNGIIDWSIQHLTKTTAQWNSDTTTILLRGQLGVEDTGNSSFKIKIGNGIDLWATLNYISGSGGSSTWGAITGTLSSQTDLQAALDAKLNKSGSNADQDLDLGNFAVNAKSLKVNGTNGNGNLSLKHQASNSTASANETAIFAGSDGEVYYKNDGNSVVQFASRAWVNLQGFITNVVTALGYTPENVSNKSSSYTSSSTTTYANTKALVDGLATKSSRSIHDLVYSGVPHTALHYQRGTTTPSANVIFYYPYDVSVDRVVTDIGIEVTTAIAASTIRLALYNSNATGTGPSTLIEESGTIASTTTGRKSYTFSPSARTLLASNKRYWLAIQTSSGTVVVRSGLIIAVSQVSTGAGNGIYTISQAYGAFPADASAAAVNTGSSMALISLTPQ